MLYRCSLLVIIFLWPLLAGAQEIKGDTIVVSADYSAMITFPGEIISKSILCRDGQYRLDQLGKQLTIIPATELPVSKCLLLVKEGSEGKQREHQFYINFTTSPDANFETFHDLHTLDLLKERIAKVEEANKKAAAEKKAQEDATAAAANPAPASDAQQAPTTTAAVATNTSATTSGFDVDEKHYIDQKEFEVKVANNIKALTRFLEILVAKKDPNYKGVIDLAMKLFNEDESKMVTVVSNSGRKDKPIKKYLVAMSQLPYNKAIISWNNIQYVSGLKQQADGSYTATVVFEQEFTGIKDGAIAHKDKQKKNIEIIVKVTEEFADGKNTRKWTIFFGNIGVAEQTS